jgi:hypothetical protein
MVIQAYQDVKVNLVKWLVLMVLKVNMHIWKNIIICNIFKKGRRGASGEPGVKGYRGDVGETGINGRDGYDFN